jgi:ubiquinone/menaquinone biosynthesis C-methylase UbiE
MSKFVNPADVIAEANIEPGQVVVDLGCGGGFYTIPAAKQVGPSGKVYAVDILESKLAVTQSGARQIGLKNVYVIKGDVDKPLIDIPEASVDVVIIASIIHQIYSKESLLHNVYRMLKTGGRVLAVDWKKQASPFGPALEVRVSAEELVQIMAMAAFKKEKEIPADPYHYGLIFIK